MLASNILVSYIPLLIPKYSTVFHFSFLKRLKYLIIKDSVKYKDYPK